MFVVMSRSTNFYYRKHTFNADFDGHGKWLA
jgi:hypothetical protein